MTQPAVTVPTSLYRYYDEHGVLLYVGITGRGVSRNSEHNKSKPWWPFVVSQTVEHFATRAEALGAERRAIGGNRPPYNVQHNPRHADMRAAYEDLRQLRTYVSEGVREDVRFPIHIPVVPVDFLSTEATLVLRSHIKDAPHLEHVHSGQYPIAFTMHGSKKVQNKTAHVQVQGPVMTVAVSHNKFTRKRPLVAAEVTLKRMCQKPIRDVVATMHLNDVNRGRF